MVFRVFAPVEVHFVLVFLNESNTVKLGDFGLSKQLAQATFANTYVGVSDVFISV